MSVDVGQVRDCLVAGWERKIWAGVLSDQFREKKRRKQRLDEVYEWRLEKLGDQNPKPGEASTVYGSLFFFPKKRGLAVAGRRKARLFLGFSFGGLGFSFDVSKLTLVNFHPFLFVCCDLYL